MCVCNVCLKCSFEMFVWNLCLKCLFEMFVCLRDADDGRAAAEGIFLQLHQGRGTSCRSWGGRREDRGLLTP